MSSGIKATDSPTEKFAKILPADVTAAFLSIKAGLEAALGQGDDAHAIVYSFVAILVVCPFYFAILMNVKNVLQNVFLCLSFVVFGLSIASVDFINVSPPQYATAITIASIVLPIVWAFLVSPMFLKVFGDSLSSSPSDDSALKNSVKP